jgi:major membrane immunogen (membrane-anchored lipoprotein)
MGGAGVGHDFADELVEAAEECEVVVGATVFGEGFEGIDEAEG